MPDTVFAMTPYVHEGLVDFVVESPELLDREVLGDRFARDDDLDAVLHAVEAPAHHHGVALAVLGRDHETHVIFAGGVLLLPAAFVVGIADELRRLIDVHDPRRVLDRPRRLVHEAGGDELIAQAVDALKVLLDRLVAVHGAARFASIFCRISS